MTSQPSRAQSREETRCGEYVEHALSRDPTIKFLFEKLTQACALSADAKDYFDALTDILRYCQAGCAVDDRFIRLEKCKPDTAGGFRPPDGVSQLTEHSMLLH